MLDDLRSDSHLYRLNGREKQNFQFLIEVLARHDIRETASCCKLMCQLICFQWSPIVCQSEIADTFKQLSRVRFILNSKPSRLQRPYLLSEGHSLLSISHTLNVYKKRSPTLVHWPCGREVWWDLSMQRYDFFPNKQTFKPEICIIKAIFYIKSIILMQKIT